MQEYMYLHGQFLNNLGGLVMHLPCQVQKGNSFAHLALAQRVLIAIPGPHKRISIYNVYTSCSAPRGYGTLR